MGREKEMKRQRKERKKENINELKSKKGQRINEKSKQKTDKEKRFIEETRLGTNTHY